ncbi:MAG: hypothetical protein VX398_03600 [Acidobacteriota bacterium]|nr:hypothetical protein [Acidobacteriota bacterium]
MAILIHGPLQVVARASDADEQLVQVPGIAWLALSVVEFLGEGLPELQTPQPHGFVADGDPVLR